MTRTDQARGAIAPTQDSDIRIRKREAARSAYVERVIASCSQTNRATVAAFIQAKRAAGLKTTSLQNLAVALAHLDAAATGTRLEDLTPEALVSILEQYTRTHSPASANGWAAIIRGYYRWLHDDELPKAIQRALKRQHKAQFADVEVLSEQEFRALLDVAGQGPQRAAAAKRQALVWLLWDSGFRISEALSLRVGDFCPDDRGGANLRLRKGAPDLKTGPRTIYVVECVGALRVWLALHPDGTDESAPLFPAKNDRTTSLWSQNVNAILERCCKQAGIRKVNPHLFRHTRATRAAEAGWNEPKMRAYFGWSRSSEMPAHYIHLSSRNMEDQVRRDAGIDESGRVLRQDVDDGAFEAKMKAFLRKMMMDA